MGDGGGSGGWGGGVPWWYLEGSRSKVWGLGLRFGKKKPDFLRTLAPVNQLETKGHETNDLIWWFGHPSEARSIVDSSGQGNQQKTVKENRYNMTSNTAAFSRRVLVFSGFSRVLLLVPLLGTASKFPQEAESQTFLGQYLLFCCLLVEG